jgi:hypothetical protein
MDEPWQLCSKKKTKRSQANLRIDGTKAPRPRLLGAGSKLSGRGREGLDDVSGRIADAVSISQVVGEWY